MVRSTRSRSRSRRTSEDSSASATANDSSNAVASSVTRSRSRSRDLSKDSVSSTGGVSPSVLADIGRAAFDSVLTSQQGRLYTPGELFGNARQVFRTLVVAEALSRSSSFPDVRTKQLKESARRACEEREGTLRAKYFAEKNHYRITRGTSVGVPLSSSSGGGGAGTLSGSVVEGDIGDDDDDGGDQTGGDGVNGDDDSVSGMRLTSPMTESITNVVTHRGKHIHTINGFPLIDSKPAESLYSKNFTVGGKTFQLVCYPGGEKEKHLNL